jgi:NAD(P)-dependent dehydrogenase (short-subunit alcohol dehydrogenase family)
MANATGLALVTGASSGIGFELAKLFADDGSRLAAAALNAGVGRAGPFVGGDLDEDLSMTDMAGSGTGKVLLTSSISSTMPGLLQTDFFRRAGMLDTVVGRMPKDDPAAVAKQGYDPPTRGDRKVVAASALSMAMGLANRVLPDSAKAVASQIISTRTEGNR